MGKKFFTRPVIIYIIGALLFVGLFVTIETINQKLWTNDLRVYYEATRDFFSGNNPYVKAYGLDTGYFKYPPFTLYLFSIFTIIPFWLAQVFHIGLSFVALAISLPLLKQLAERLSPSNRSFHWVLLIGFLSIMVHLSREFHMGNINLVLLMLFTLGIFHFNDTKLWKSILPWSLMIILKPIMILAVIPLIVFKKWKQLFLLAGMGMFFLLFPVVTQGIGGTVQLWQDWFQSISEHGEYIVSYNSFKYISEFYFGVQSSWGLSIIGLLTLITLMGIHIFIKKEVKIEEWIIVFTAFIPNFFVTDTEHFLLSAPLVMLLAYQLRERKSWFFWTLFILAFIPLSLNSMDFLGRELSTQVDIHGGTGLGNFTMILLYIVVLFTSKSPVKAENL